MGRHDLGPIKGEMEDAAAVVSNALGFGANTPKNSAADAAADLTLEIGKVLDVDLVIMHGIIDADGVMQQWLDKRRRFLDPSASTTSAAASRPRRRRARFTFCRSRPRPPFAAIRSADRAEDAAAGLKRLRPWRRSHPTPLRLYRRY